eukprot:5916787-Pyramimonas_sp.AAC.2
MCVPPCSLCTCGLHARHGVANGLPRSTPRINAQSADVPSSVEDHAQNNSGTRSSPQGTMTIVVSSCDLYDRGCSAQMCPNPTDESGEGPVSQPRVAITDIARSILWRHKCPSPEELEGVA